MKIFLVTPSNNGCSKWRAEIPAKYLKRRGHTVHFFEEFKNAGCPDVIVFARTYIGDLLPLYRWAKSKNIRTVYDTDDAIDLVDESNPAYDFSRTRIAQARFMMTNADVVTTTTPELAEHLRRWNRSVSVIPNSIDPEEWTIRPREPKREMRIGWAGGNTHYRDVALVMDALSDLQARTRFKFVVHGLTTMPSVRELYESRLQTHGESFRTSVHGKSIRRFLKKGESLDYEFHPSVQT
jgi:glycosyltransferase involved in cell wall biosynthesis